MISRHALNSFRTLKFVVKSEQSVCFRSASKYELSCFSLGYLRHVIVDLTKMNLINPVEGRGYPKIELSFNNHFIGDNLY